MSTKGRKGRKDKKIVNFSAICFRMMKIIRNFAHYYNNTY